MYHCHLLLLDHELTLEHCSKHMLGDDYWGIILPFWSVGSPLQQAAADDEAVDDTAST